MGPTWQQFPKEVLVLLGLQPRLKQLGYSLEAALGAGGTSEVFRAVRTRDGHPVAIKLLQATEGRLSERRELFDRELKALRALVHPGIVALLDSGQFEFQVAAQTVTFLFLVLELGDISLEQELVKRQQPYLPSEAARMIAPIADAVAFAHEQNPSVLHLDIKPGNLIRVGNTWKLTDFNIARFGVTEGLGTQNFRSPELIRSRGSSPGPAADVFGLGATLYTALTGDVVDEKQLARGLFGRTFNHRTNDLPRNLIRILKGALHPDPRWRYQSAADLAKDLRAWLSDGPVRPPIEPSWARYARYLRRPSTISAAVVSATLLAVLASVYGVSNRNRLVEKQDELTKQQQEFTKHKTKTAEEVSHLKTAVTSAKTERDQAVGKAEDTSKKLQTTLVETGPGLAKVYFDKGQRSCESGDIPHGMLWFAEAWKTAAAAGNKDWERFLRLNVSAWRHHLPYQVKALIRLSDESALSADGSVVATVDKINLNIRLWSTRTGEPVGRPIPYGDRVTRARPDPKYLQAFGFSPDSKSIFSSVYGGAVCLWSASTGEPIGTPMLHGEYDVPEAVFSSDGRFLLAKQIPRAQQLGQGRSRNTLGQPAFEAQLWSAKNGEPTGKAFPVEVPRGSVAISADGAVVAIVSGRVQLWSTRTCKPVGDTYPRFGDPLEHDFITYFQFNSDGSTALAITETGRVQLLSAKTGQPIGPRFLPEGVKDPDFSPPRHLVMTNAASFIRRPAIKNLLIRPDGKAVLVAGHDAASLWSAATGKRLGASMPHSDLLKAAFSADGSLIMTAGGKDVKIWSARNCAPIGKPLTHAARVVSMDYVPNSKTVITGEEDRRLQSWTIQNSTADAEQLTDGWLAGPQDLFCIAPDGQTLFAQGSDDWNLRFWSIVLPPRISLRRSNVDSPDGKGSAIMSPDGNVVITEQASGEAQLWSVTTGESIGSRIANVDATFQPVFSPDGQLLVVCVVNGESRGNKLQIELRNSSTGERICPPFTPDGTLIKSSVRFASNGRVLGTLSVHRTSPAGSQNSRFVELWSTTTGKRIGNPLSDDQRDATIAFSPDGLLAATVQAGVVRLWSTLSGQPHGKAMSHPGTGGVAFSPTGRVLLSVGEDLRLWSTTNSEQLGREIDGPRETGNLPGRGGEQKKPRPFRFSSTGAFLVTMSHDQSNLQLWDASTSAPIGDHIHLRDGITFQNGMTLAPQIPTTVEFLDGDRILAVSPTEGGNIGAGGATSFWTTATGDPIGKSIPVDLHAIAATADGRLIAVSSRDGRTRFYRMDTVEESGPPISASSPQIAFSPDGTLISIGRQLYSVTTRLPIGKRLPEPSQKIEAIRFAPDGSASFAESQGDEIRCWRLAEVPDDVARCTAWVQVVTGKEIDSEGALKSLDAENWLARRRLLDQLGGPF
jgi:WD40 repeat protein/serine/threonine protein kinase